MSIFGTEPNPTPTSIGNLELRLRTDGEGGQQASFYYEVLDENGAILATRRGDAVPHLLPAEITALQDLMARARGLAVAALPQ